MWKKTFIILISFIVNGLTNTTPANLLVTIPQFCIVLFYIITGKIEKAVFWHFIFFTTSFTYYGNFEGLVEQVQMVSYNYAKLKLIGPVSYSILISIILFVLVNIKRPNNIKQEKLFYSFYKLIIILMGLGIVIGIIGLIFSDYYIEGMINYGSYILIIFIHTNILIKMINTNLRNEFYNIIVPLLALSSICTFVIHQIHPNMWNSPGVSFYSLLLLPAIFFQRDIKLPIIGLIFQFYNMINYGASGKSLILLLLILIITFALSTKKEIKNKYPIRARFILIGTIAFIVFIPTFLTIIANTYGSSSFTVSKIYQTRTLLNFIFQKGDVIDIAESPYIRVTSLINILYEGLQNPFALFFGKGYGGYFRDHFNYFGHLNLYQGGFPDKAIISGNYFTGHDTMVTVPMFNGLLGLYLILLFVWKCVKFAKNNYAILAAIPFLLLTFYFDTLIGISGVLILYAGSLNVNETEHFVHSSFLRYYYK